MKKCLLCNELYPSSHSECTACQHQIPQIDGFSAFAPALSIEGEGFKSEYFSELISLEENNFWFRARNEIIQWAISKYCLPFNHFLEIGCGTGYVLQGIASKFPSAKLTGSELFSTGLKYASARVPTAQFFQMDARSIPFIDEYDAIGAFDVLEHIEEDSVILEQIHQSLRKNGVLLLTVPQHPWLWSATDELACHVRRYTASDLHHKLAAANFECVRSTSFVSTLLPAMLLSRLRKQSAHKSNKTELALSPTLNKIFYSFLRFERMLIEAGANFPLGGSRLVIARKIS